MKYIEVIADAGSAKSVEAAAERVDALDVRLGVVGPDGQQAMRLLVSDDKVQRLLDLLQGMLGAQPSARILVLGVEACIPPPNETERKQQDSATAAREALYESIDKGSRLGSSYLTLVVLSTVVAAIGLIEDNVAVIIGAMVIAPLLGPNLALSLGTALGDIPLMRRSVDTLLAGISLALALTVALGWAWPEPLASQEIMARTQAGLDSVVLALASGAAAALSVTTGLSSVLVGVMVAVALLPPAATLGLMIGQGRWELALGAGLLLLINIVSVNLSSKLVFFFKGVRPRTWLAKETARRAMRTYVLVWVVTLLVLVLVVLARRYQMVPV